MSPPMRVGDALFVSLNEEHAAEGPDRHTDPHWTRSAYAFRASTLRVLRSFHSCLHLSFPFMYAS